MKLEGPQIAKIIQITNQDWADSIHLAKEYYESLLTESRSGPKVLQESEWIELKEAWTEYNTLLGLQTAYKEMLLNKDVQGALELSDKVLFNPETSPKELETLLKGILHG